MIGGTDKVSCGYTELSQIRAIDWKTMADLSKIISLQAIFFETSLVSGRGGSFVNFSHKTWQNPVWRVISPGRMLTWQSRVERCLCILSQSCNCKIWATDPGHLRKGSRVIPTMTAEERTQGEDQASSTSYSCEYKACQQDKAWSG